jgi:pyrrolidone-carboxylate peptidase
MRTIIFTGFRPFGTYKANATGMVATQIGGTKMGGFKIASVLYETTISKKNRGAELFAYAKLTNAAAIVSMGMASEKTGLCVEAVAVNRIYHSKYVTGEDNNKPVDASRPYLENLGLDLAPWNVDAFSNRCRAKSIPVMAPSSESGGFCCNQLMYQYRVEQLTRGRQIPFIFFHVPCCPEAVSDPIAFAEAGKVTMETSKIIWGLEVLLEGASL